MNKLKRGLVIVAMAGLVFVGNVPTTQVSAATKSCTTVSANCVGTTFNCGGLNYKVTSNNTVTCTGFKKSNSKATSCTIPSTVTCNGTTYNVTKVASNAFSKCKNLKKVNCSSKISKLGKNCFGNAVCNMYK